jgi:two-component system, LytTR family, response regulator
MISAILVDDEAGNLEVLSRLISGFCPNVSILACASSVDEACIVIKEKKPDVVFLDIEMPGKTGFDLIHLLEPVTFEIIFVTAFEQYASKAFRYSAIDYLLKPVNIDELQEAVERATKNIIHKTMGARLENYFENINLKQPKIAIPMNDSYTFYDYDTIVSLTATDPYTQIHFTDGTKVISSSSLKYFSELLPKNLFCRIHHAHLVNLNHAVKYSGSRSGKLQLSNGLVLEVSQRKRGELLKRFGKK